MIEDKKLLKSINLYTNIYFLSCPNCLFESRENKKKCKECCGTKIVPIPFTELWGLEYFLGIKKILLKDYSKKLFNHYRKILLFPKVIKD